MENLFVPKDIPNFTHRFAQTVLVILILAVSFLVFFYTDFSDTLDNAVMLAETICNGDFLDYYHYASINAKPLTVFTANYNVFLYTIFAIYNLPTVILHIATDFDYTASIPALLWCKSLVLVATICTSFVIRKTILKISDGGKTGAWAQLLFLASSCVIVPTMIAGQYDILALFFMTLGLYFYIANKDFLFTIMFVIAMPLKSFAIFIYIPLVLLRTKNIPLIILKILAIFVLDTIVALPFINDPWYHLCIDSQNRDAMNLVLGANVQFAGLNFNLFFAAFISICVYSYIKKSEAGNEFLPIWISYASIISFVLFVRIRSYWIILFVPFAVMLLFAKNKYLRVNTLLLVIGAACQSIYSLITHWVYNSPSLVSKLVLPLLTDINKTGYLKYTNTAGFFEAFGITPFTNTFYTIFVIAAILLLIINIPCSERRGHSSLKETVPENWLMYVQIGISAMLICITIYAYIAPTNPPVYAVENSGEYMAENILEDTVVKQEFITSDVAEQKVSELIFTAENNNNDRKNRNALHFSILDGVTGEELLHEIIGVALIEKSAETKYKFEEVELKPSHPYIVQFSGEKVRHNTSLKMQVCEKTKDDRTLTINDDIVDGELMFILK